MVLTSCLFFGTLGRIGEKMVVEFGMDIRLVSIVPYDKLWVRCLILRENSLDEF